MLLVLKSRLTYSFFTFQNIKIWCKMLFNQNLFEYADFLLRKNYFIIIFDFEC